MKTMEEPKYYWLLHKQMGFGQVTDLIFVTYNAQTTFKKGDIVTVYGDVSGTYNYISASLGNLTLVKITARYIELTPNTAPTLVPVPFTSPETNNTNTTTNSSGSLNITNNNSTNPTNQPTNSNPSPTTSNVQPV